MELLDPDLGLRPLSPPENRIHRLLTLVGEGPAAFFFDACRLMDSKLPFHSTTHLVAHLLREIESSMRAVLLTLADSDPTAGGKAPDKEHERQICTILKALDMEQDDDVAKFWLSLAGKEEESGLSARAHRRALFAPRLAGDDFRSFWHDFQTMLGVVLDHYEAKYLKLIPMLDSLLATALPSPNDAKRLCQKVPNHPILRDYFFSRLQSPAWLPVLEEEGFFKQPPGAVTDVESGAVSYPPWPESAYLARIAGEESEPVARIILAIPTTDNVQVHQDIVEAALRLPGDAAAAIALKECKWVSRQRFLHMLLPEKLAALAAHLAKDGHAQAALELARSLLDVSQGLAAQSGVERGRPGNSMARMSDWQYARCLTTCLPQLMEADGLGTLTMVCDLLQEAVAPCGHGSPEGTSGPDVDLWRPAIEEHGQNHLYGGIPNLLVSAVRDSAETALPEQGAAVMQTVDSHCGAVFMRLGLHLRRKSPGTDPSGTARLVTDRKVLDDPMLHHELYLLLQERFGDFAVETQKAYFGIVKQGPTGPLVKAKDRWQYYRLLPIEAYLDSEWRGRFEDLRGRFGAREHPDFLVYTGEMLWMGPKSPSERPDPRSEPVSEVIRYLKTWQPADDPLGPSREGMARDLSAAVADQPGRFTGNLLAFRELDPTYVRGVLNGYREAVRQKHSFDWAPILELARWVTEQPREDPEVGDEYQERDPGWGWTRKAIADLLVAGFEDSPAQIPAVLRKEAWQVLLPLTHDPDPTPESEKRFGGTNMDPPALAINTVRGQALHAVVGYAHWVRRQARRSGQSTDAMTFGVMPEVREILDRHLDPVDDPSAAVRAVYGQYLPWLIMMDREWAKENVCRIFPTDPAQAHLTLAAWETYVVYCQAYDTPFELLQDQYVRAVNRIGEAGGSSRHLVNPEDRLVDHLMTLYWRGKLALDNTQGLLARFYSHATPALRAHAISFIGRTLQATSEPVPPGVLQRLQILWQVRLDANRGVRAGSEQDDERVSFGWWFASGKFELTWELDQLGQVLLAVGMVEPADQVLERLAQLAEKEPRQTLDCLRLMVMGDKSGHLMLVWHDDAHAILAQALKADDSTVREAAVDLVNRLGARGFVKEFRDLLG